MMTKIEKMTSEQFAYYCNFSFEKFLKESAKSSGKDIETLRLSVGGPPDRPTENDLWFVIKCDEHEAGFIWIQLQPKKNAAFLYDIYLNNEHRSKGLGRKVMLMCIEHIKKNAIEKLKLCVFQDNMIARKLYASLGFKETDFNLERRQYSLELTLSD